jgi:hypothetical protein
MKRKWMFGNKEEGKIIWMIQGYLQQSLYNQGWSQENRYYEKRRCVFLAKEAQICQQQNENLLLVRGEAGAVYVERT